MEKFVPTYTLFTTKNLNDLLLFFSKCKHKKLLVLTGAGISTESGIPDYRSPLKGIYSGDNPKMRKPVTYQEFINSPIYRKRFWARHYIGYEYYTTKKPNNIHFTLANWINKGLTNFLITQNVDDLHQKAGISNDKLVQMHGSFHSVYCLNCKKSYDRNSLQNFLQNANKNWKYTIIKISPDAYAQISDEDLHDFANPICDNCNSDMLKPGVVFIGENIPQSTYGFINNQIIFHDYLLVLGTSLSMYSAYRIVHEFHKAGKPIAIINIGETRGDHLANIKIDTKIGAILPQIDRCIHEFL